MAQFKIGQIVYIGSESSMNFAPKTAKGEILNDWSSPCQKCYSVVIKEIYNDDYYNIVDSKIGDIEYFNDYELSPM